MVKEAVEEINSFIFAVTCEERVKEGFFEDFLGVSDGLGVVIVLCLWGLWSFLHVGHGERRAGIFVVGM